MKFRLLWFNEPLPFAWDIFLVAMGLTSFDFGFDVLVLVLRFWFYGFGFTVLVLRFWFYGFGFTVLVLRFWFWGFDFVSAKGTNKPPAGPLYL